MQLIARVSIRRHLIESLGEPGAICRPPKNVAVFRVLGQSPHGALKTLEAHTTPRGANAMVALTLASETLTDAQAEVCQAIIAQCRKQTMEFAMCGGDFAQLRKRVAPGLALTRWFPTVAEMVQQLGGQQPGKEDTRPTGRNSKSLPGDEALM